MAGYRDPDLQERQKTAFATKKAMLEKFLAKANDPAIRALREALTQEALAAGVFGAPTYVVDGELFWGQDRLDFLERRLAER